MKEKDRTSQCHQSTSSSPISVQLRGFQHYLNASGPSEDLLMSEEASEGKFQGRIVIILSLRELEILVDVEVGRDGGMGQAIQDEEQWVLFVQALVDFRPGMSLRPKEGVIVVPSVFLSCL